MTLLRIAATAWAMTTTSCGGPPGAPVRDAGDVIELVELVRHVPFTLGDEYGIQWVADMISTPSGYAVADAGHFVLFLDEQLRPTGRFGSEGSGPEELRAPQDLEVWKDEVLVYDGQNGRVTAVDEVGVYRRTIVGEGTRLTDFAVRADGRILVGRQGPVSRLGFYGSDTPFGRVPEELADDDRPTSPWGSTNAMLVATSDGRIHHYDTGAHRLYSYAPDGSVLAVRRFSNHTAAQLADQLRSAEKAFGRGAVLEFTPVLGLGSWGPYPVMTAPDLPGLESVALVFDPVEPLVTRAVPGEGMRGFPDVVWSVALKRDRLTLVNHDGFYHYRIEAPDHIQVPLD